MNNRNTIYERMSAEGKRRARIFALSVPCPYCKAGKGAGCVGIGGKPSKPHSSRIVNGGDAW